MSSVAVEEPQPSPVLRMLGFKDRACGVCGWRFFTTAALYEHEAECDARPPTPDQVAAWKTPAPSNAGRRECDVCGMVSTPGGLGAHQHFSGHVGWTGV